MGLVKSPKRWFVLKKKYVIKNISFQMCRNHENRIIRYILPYFYKVCVLCFFVTEVLRVNFDVSDITQKHTCINLNRNLTKEMMMMVMIDVNVSLISFRHIFAISISKRLSLDLITIKG